MHRLGPVRAYPTGEDLKDEHILQAVDETVPLAKTMEEDIRNLRDWAKDRARLASGTKKKKPKRRTPLKQAVKKRSVRGASNGA